MPITRPGSCRQVCVMHRARHALRPLVGCSIPVRQGGGYEGASEEELLCDRRQAADPDEVPATQRRQHLQAPTNLMTYRRWRMQQSYD